jgi:pyocin large subunit-like protein
MFDPKKNRFAVVTSDGHIVHSTPAGRDREGKPVPPPMKPGWRFATTEDIAKAAAAESKRSAREAAEAADALVAAKAATEAKDKALAAQGGPLKK